MYELVSKYLIITVVISMATTKAIVSNIAIRRLNRVATVLEKSSKVQHLIFRGPEKILKLFVFLKKKLKIELYNP